MATTEIVLQSVVAEFINDVRRLAVQDVLASVPKYDKTNTREAIMQRVRNPFSAPRKGDGTNARRIYSAAYWMMEVHATDEEPTD